jgi:hypothetical protein
MSFEQVCKELLTSAERSAVLRVVNNSSHQLDVKACNIWQGRWHIEPEAVPPHSEKVIAAKSQGFRGGTKADVTFCIKADKNRSYLLQWDNPYSATPNEKSKIQYKMATNLTVDPPKIVAELIEDRINGGQVVATFRVSDK